MKTYQRHRKSYRKNLRSGEKSSSRITVKDKIIAIIAFIGIFVLAVYLALVVAMH
jgi:hypothetical protein